MKNLEDISEWYLSQQLNFDKKLIQYRYKTIQKYFRGKYALELGPGNGEMTNLLLSDFESLDVVDGSSNLLDQLPTNERLIKHHSYFEDFKPSRAYNTIIMEHVLEHLENPKLVLGRVKTWLEDENSSLIIGVPNAKSFHRLAAVKMGILPSEYTLNDRDKMLGHFRVYDLKALVSEVMEAGFKIIGTGGVFFKPLSNKQIDQFWSDEMIDAFYELGKDFQENAAEIFVVATR